MTQARFFQLSLFFPLVLGVGYLIALLLGEKQDIGIALNKLFEAYPIFLPYIVFTAIMWKISDNKPFSRLVLIALIAPLVWGLFYAFSYVVQYYIKEQMTTQWFVLLIMVFWATVAGYILEAVPLLVLVIFKDNFRPAVQNTGPIDEVDKGPTVRPTA